MEQSGQFNGESKGQEGKEPPLVPSEEGKDSSGISGTGTEGEGGG